MCHRVVSVLLGIVGLCLLSPPVKTAAAPSTTMSVTPTCTSGTTITCSDETTRNNNISTPYNSHTHTDISAMSGVNTFTIGDGTAGNKDYCEDATTDRCIRWDNTNNLWVIQQPTASYNEIATYSGTVGLTARAVVVGDGTGALRSLPTGSSGQVLQSNGASSDPSWVSATESGTWSDVSGSRVAGTIYQNTSGKKRRVAIWVNGAGTAKLSAKIDVGSSSPPTLVLEQHVIDVNAGATQHSAAFYYEVPNNWYHRLTVTTGSLQSWMELDE